MENLVCDESEEGGDDQGAPGLKESGQLVCERFATACNNARSDEAENERKDKPVGITQTMSLPSIFALQTLKRASGHKSLQIKTKLTLSGRA